MQKKAVKIRKYLPVYIMLLPGFLYLLVNNYIPMTGMIIAFKNVDFAKGILRSDWIGFKNFEYLFRTKDAWIITRNTLGYNLLFIVLDLVLAVTMAIILNELHQKKAAKVYQTIFMAPYFLSWVVVSFVAYKIAALTVGLRVSEESERQGLDISSHGEVAYTR